MVNKNKVKGSTWERQVAEKFNTNLESTAWKRVPGSGALGTILQLDILRGDVRGNFEFTNKPIIIECKTGYGGAKQLTIKKEWLDKIQEEADMSFGLGILAGKFLGARQGVKQFIVMDMVKFLELMKIAESNALELKEVYKELLDK